MGAVGRESSSRRCTRQAAAYMATRGATRRRKPARGPPSAARAPDQPVPGLLLADPGEPMMSSTLLLAADPQPLTSGREIQARLGQEIDAVLDGGDCGIEPTTVVDLSVKPPAIVRKGKGALGPLPGRAL